MKFCVVIFALGACSGDKAGDTGAFTVADIADGLSAAGHITVNGERFNELSAISYYPSSDPYRPIVVIITHPYASCENRIVEDYELLSWLRDPNEATSNHWFVKATLVDPDHDVTSDPEGLSYVPDAFDSEQTFGGEVVSEVDSRGIYFSMESVPIDDLQTVVQGAALPIVYGRLAGSVTETPASIPGGVIEDFAFDVTVRTPLCGTDTIE